MKAIPNRLNSLIFSGLTTIGLIVTYLMWMIMDELTRSVYPPGLLIAIVLGVGIIIASPGLFRRSHRKIHMLLIGLYIAALIIGWNVDWSPTKPFYRFYSRIRVGMSIDEVQQKLDQSFPPNGAYPKPRTEIQKRLTNGQTAQLFRLEPPLSAEIITVDFAEGRVTKTEYLPD